MAPKVQNEQRLLTGVRQLDPDTLTEVHDLYYAAIFRYIAFRVGSQETAEDLTSEVFTRLLSAVRDRSAPQNTLRGWLYGVASRVVADHHRKQYREDQMKTMAIASNDSADPLDVVANKLTVAVLASAISDLTKDQQEVIALRFGYGMPIREAANMMGKSEGAIKQLQARAIASLTRVMTGKGTR